jgi:hypothetical protein
MPSGVFGMRGITPDGPLEVQSQPTRVIAQRKLHGSVTLYRVYPILSA